MSVMTHTPAELEIMAEGGRRLVKILSVIKEQVVPGVSLKTLDMLARTHSEKLGGRPSFLGYRGYPAAICASLNHGIVHCIPTDHKLQEGDLVSIDFGFYYQGFHTDSAITWIVGQDINNYLPLLQGVYRALQAGINTAKAGVKVGAISQAIATSLKKDHLTVMRQFMGHGVGRDLHEEPGVPNFVGPDKDVILPEGCTIAIEPIAGTGGEASTTLADRWSVQTTDRQPVAHFEATVALTPLGAEILTPIQDILGFTP